MEVVIDGNSLRIEQVAQVARQNLPLLEEMNKVVLMYEDL